MASGTCMCENSILSEPVSTRQSQSAVTTTTKVVTGDTATAPISANVTRPSGMQSNNRMSTPVTPYLCTHLCTPYFCSLCSVCAPYLNIAQNTTANKGKPAA